MTDSVVISQIEESRVEIQAPNQAAIELSMTGIGIRGPIGPVGPPGPNEIGGFPVVVAGAQENDTLLLKSWTWQNTPQEALTDGGNF